MPGSRTTYAWVPCMWYSETARVSKKIFRTISSLLFYIIQRHIFCTSMEVIWFLKFEQLHSWKFLLLVNMKKICHKIQSHFQHMTFLLTNWPILPDSDRQILRAKFIEVFFQQIRSRNRVLNAVISCNWDADRFNALQLHFKL